MPTIVFIWQREQLYHPLPRYDPAVLLPTHPPICLSGACGPRSPVRSPDPRPLIPYFVYGFFLIAGLITAWLRIKSVFLPTG